MLPKIQAITSCNLLQLSQ